MPYQCYKCQEFGHSAINCRNKVTCSKCGEEHPSKDCDKQQLNCSNCAKRGYAGKNHKTFDRIACAVYKEEILKAKNNTDHGFDD